MTDVLQPWSSPADDWPVTWPDCLPNHMTLEDFLKWEHEGVHAEWVDGEVELMAAVRISRLQIRWFLGLLLGGFCQDHRLGDVFFVPTRLLLSPRPSVREPDLMFIATAHEDRIKDIYVDGPVDIVIEIIDDDSEERDRATKFVEYEAAGVTEYWLIDPLRHEALFYVLGEDGRYHLARTTSDGIYQSSVVEGFRLRPDWLWREPLPSPEDALAELPA